MEDDKNITMVEGTITPDAHLMIGALISVLRMREPSVGTSAMLAVLSAHFVNMGVQKEEFLNICTESYNFYKAQIDQENAKRDVKDADK